MGKQITIQFQTSKKSSKYIFHKEKNQFVVYRLEDNYYQ